MPASPRRAACGPRASLSRIYATFLKEILQLRRDRITFAMMIVIPLVQLLLFGYAINTDPKHLPTAVLIQDDSAFARSFLAALRATDYFASSRRRTSEDELDHLLLSGGVQFGVQIPAHFGRDLIRGERPALLIVADATDPSRDRRRRRRARRSRAERSRAILPARRTSRRNRRPSNCACIAATIPGARRGSTSCPG